MRAIGPAVSFFVVGGGELALATLLPWWAAWAPLWAGLGTVWVGLAYLVNRPAWLGKGYRDAIAGAVLLPFFTLARTAARTARRGGVSAPPDEIVPGLWVAGWPTRGAPGFAQLDVTAELPRRGDALRYACVPMLDGAAPPPEAWDAAVAQALAWRREGLPVLVHCAYGHGRSVSVVLGVLVAEGRFRTFDDALAHVRTIRPRARLTAAQRAHLAGLPGHPAERTNVG